MDRLSTLVRKRGADLISGELFIMELGGEACLMIKFFVTENGSTVVGVLRGKSFSTQMFFYAGNFEGPCLSYGANWILEEIYDDTTYPDRSFERTAALFIDDDDIRVFRFRPNQGQVGALHFAIGEEKHRELGSYAAPVPEFRIWANRSAYEDMRASPVFHYRDE